MFSRQDVCALTGIPVARFKSLARRNQLPTPYVPPAGASEDAQDHAKERGWNWFSPIDVLNIAVQERLMMQIGYADGFGADTAANVVTNNAGDIGRIFWLASARIGEPSRMIFGLVISDTPIGLVAAMVAAILAARLLRSSPSRSIRIPTMGRRHASLW